MNWTYTLIMLAAVGAGLALFWRTREPLGLSWPEKLAVGIGASCGGMIGAKLPFALADWQGFLDGTAWFDDGKTIMSGLLGGYLGVQAAEWALDIRRNIGDSLAAPLATAVGIGRLACFSAGCCYGMPTALPWGVDFGDALLRHPTQLYESAFHLTAAVILYQLHRRHIFQGRLIKYYFIAYLAYRFLSEFVRPEPALWLGLTGYQWASLALMPFFALWSCPSCRPRRVLGQPSGPPRLEVDDRQPHLLKQTRTLCPTCLEPVVGTTYQHNGKVYLRRECAEHGTSVALLSADRRRFYLRHEVPHAALPQEGLPKDAAADATQESQRPAGAACCPDGPRHRTCIALLELTDACNLRCPVCFAASCEGRHRRYEDLCADLEAFLATRGPLDVLQLSGGEPLLHPDLLRIIDHARTLPVDYIMINTNGLQLLRQEGLTAELAARRPRLEINLQFDGLDDRCHEALRGQPLTLRKQAVLKKLAEHELPTTLVCTVARGVNEDQLGPLLRMGLQSRHIRGVTFQPATFAGRFDREADPLDRITLAEVVDLLGRQSDGLLVGDDFKPLPCSHPNCCGFTFIARPRRRRALPLTRIMRYEDHIERLADRFNFDLGDAQACCGINWRADDVFRVVIKPFMDAHTYDADRIEECCVHVIRPGGQPISFCRFNTLERSRTSETPAVAELPLLGR